MAGEWIKVEAATLDKPEVLRIARLLGVNRYHALGILLRFWVWLDKNCVDGVVDGVEALDVDDVMSCPGLSACLQDVDWVRFDNTARRMTVQKFDRHNGESAKKRGLRNERQARWRANSVDTPASTKASTREEKRREDTTTNVVVGKPRKAALQEPNDEHQRLAESLGVPCQAEFQKYRDWLAASGKSHRDEAAGFRNWLKNAKPLRVVGGREPTLAEKRAANMAAITGANREREVFAERVGSPPLPALPSDLREPGGDDVGGRTEGRTYRDVG